MANRNDGYFYGADRWEPSKAGGAVWRIAPGQPAEVLHTFPRINSSPTDTNYDGANPTCPLVTAPDGSFYGATDGGGLHGYGTIYRITPDGAFTVVANIQPSTGYYVERLLFTSAGELYGVAYSGGTVDGGTLFRLGADGQLEVLYDFGVDPDNNGRMPNCLVEAPGGVIYGTTTSGGWGHGYTYRYDGPGAITPVADFVKENLFVSTTYPFEESDTCLALAPDGLYVATEHMVVHVPFDGSGSQIVADYRPVTDQDAAFISGLLPAPDGLYGFSAYGGGPSGAGFIFRYVPGEGSTVLYSFSLPYRDKNRCLVLGNDGLVYGLAATPDGSLTPAGIRSAATRSALMRAAVVRAPSDPNPRTFRMRQKGVQSANFVPIAKPDVGWLPAARAANGTRSVTVNVVANDKDPDNNALTLTSVLPADTGLAEMIGAGPGTGRKLRYTVSDADPASQILRYVVSDGKGATATGFCAIRSPADGKYGATLPNTTNPAAAPGLLTLVVTNRNAITATFALGSHKYTGKAVFGVNEVADFVMTFKGQPSLQTHLELQRGTARKIAATLQSGGSTYTAVCPQTGK